MRMWKWIIVLAVSVLGSTPAKACGDYGCGDAWGGLYSVGDYNLYQFGSGMYDIGVSLGGYDVSSQYNYGGSCGSLITSCSGGYDSGNLYGSHWGLASGGSLDIGITISATPSEPISMTNSCDVCGMAPYQNYDVGCSVGYCDSGYAPYPGSSYSSNNPWFNAWDHYFNQIPTQPSYPQYPYFPPSFTQVPRDPYQNPYFPPAPPSVPPYGVCDNIVVMCPTGIVTRPTPIPGTGYSIPRDPFSPPTTFPPTVYPPQTYPPVLMPPTHTDPFYPPVAYPGTRNQLPRDPGYPISPIAPIAYPPSVPPMVNDPVFPPSPLPPTVYPPVNPLPPVILPPVTTLPVTPPTGYPPVGPVPVNPPVPTIPALIGSPIGGSNTSIGSLPPVRNQVPRGGN